MIGKVLVSSALLSLGIGLTFVGVEAADSFSSDRPLTPVEEQKLQSKDEFQECANCPRMVVVPAGSFMMGSLEDEPDHVENEGPQHRVTIAKPFSVSRSHVTRGEFAAFVKATN
jgi:formylglycine-generating enzyme required for sulfatase activity